MKTVKASEVQIGDRILTTSGAHEVTRIVPVMVGSFPARRIHYVNRNNPERPYPDVTEQVDHASMTVEENS